MFEFFFYDDAFITNANKCFVFSKLLFIICLQFLEQTQYTCRLSFVQLSSVYMLFLFAALNL